MNLKENALNGTISTVLWCAIVVAAITSVFVEKLGVDWTGASIGMGVGLGLIGFGKK